MKVSDRSENFFKPGDISVPSPLFAFLRIRRLISKNLVETRALRTFFFFFHRASSLWQRMVGSNFQIQGGVGKSCPLPPQKTALFSSEPTDWSKRPRKTGSRLTMGPRARCHYEYCLRLLSQISPRAHRSMPTVYLVKGIYYGGQ